MLRTQRKASLLGEPPRLPLNSTVIKCLLSDRDCAKAELHSLPGDLYLYKRRKKG